MTRRFQLFLQATDGSLRIVPLGHVSPAQVEPILGAAQSGLAAFPVVIIDLRDAAVVPPAVVGQLQEGLRQLVAARKLVLGLEPHRWILQQLPAEPCRCAGNCRNCRQRQQATDHNRDRAQKKA